MESITIGNNCMINVIKSLDPVPDVMKRIITVRTSEEKEDAFFCCDVGDIVEKHRKWVTALQRVQSYYPIKCNDDTVVIKVLSSLGVNFSCASKGEIKKALDLGVGPDHLFFANPCKQRLHIKYAAQHGVSLMAFDSSDELSKIKAGHPAARLILCFRPDGLTDKMQPNCSAGCLPSEVSSLLEKAKQLSLEVVGISFNLNAYGIPTPENFESAISQARDVVNQATEHGFSIELLNIGGGFLGSPMECDTFDELCLDINLALDEHFPVKCGIRVMAEPGRYFVTSAFTIAVNVIAKREVSQTPRDSDSEDDGASFDDAEEPAFMYYVNDGVYGSFSCMMYDGVNSLAPSVLDDRGNEPEFSCSIWGPTCDGLDCLTTYHILPELEIGDWIVYEKMGAYTMTSASTFNGMPQPKVHYIISENLLATLSVDHSRPLPDLKVETNSCRQQVKEVRYEMVQELVPPLGH